jgi:hypothetical protein
MGRLIVRAQVRGTPPHLKADEFVLLDGRPVEVISEVARLGARGHFNRQQFLLQLVFLAFDSADERDGGKQVICERLGESPS